jgi:hypothetical protein
MVPATSVPGINGTGGEFWCLPAIARTLAKPTPAAATWIKTLPGANTGSATSAIVTS